MFHKIRNFIRKHFIGYRPSDMSCIDYLESKGVEKMKDEEIEIYVNGEKVDITDIYEPLKQGEYFYKENGKWYVHRLKNVSFVIEEDKKIEKLTPFEAPFLKDEKPDIRFRLILDKINEIIDYINKGE